MNRAVPILLSRDLPETLGFYTALGFENRGAPLPTWEYLILGRGDIELHFSGDPTVDPLRSASMCYLYVDDARALHDEWARIVVPDPTTGSRITPPVDTDFGLREFAVVDRSGNLLRVGSFLSEAVPPIPESDAALARRAQILATEHWGLLAARGTAQSEVLTRITIFLTLVSAGLVTIGLLGQATAFEGWFGGAAIAILAFLALVGLMTQTRVMNVSEEDMMYVVAMNRLRSAYVDLDPTVADIFLAAVADDRPGMERTYSFLRRRSASVLLGSSMMLIIVVNACVLGLVAGAVIGTAGGSWGWAVGVGTAIGLFAAIAFFAYGGWTFRHTWQRYVPRRRTADQPPWLRD
ncbi:MULTISPECIES: bleomycin resistance protein [Microbacterium]|uniref:VOC family protein n=1 Tax=Microbacterium saccharophilum TaxID=1213358 RepID=A0A7Z7CZZ0_9MICO|nr:MULTISPECIES: VOC family protein [Microbacterium]SFI26649.1 hypothetical protein SAMN04487751_0758 [Microbacterium saccharophilum]